MHPMSLQQCLLAVLASGSVKITTESTSKCSLQFELLHTKNSVQVHAYSDWEETYSIDGKLSFRCYFLHLFSIFALFACSTAWVLVRRRAFQSCCTAFLGKHDLIVTSSGAFAVILTFHSFMLCQSS